MSVNSLPWYYSPVLATPGETVILAGDEWHHCHHVMRLDTGEPIILFNGIGNCFEGWISETGRYEGKIMLSHDRSKMFSTSRRYNLIIAFAPTKNIDRTEFAVEKMVELGVDEIYFLDCEYSERSKIRMDRMEKIVLSASKQSRKLYLSTLHDLISPTSLITQYRHNQPDLLLFCCHLDEKSTALVKNYSPGSDVMMLIGPEGGFSSEETEQMTHRGAQMITLGPYRLRAETAAITACAAIHILNELKETI